MLEVLVKKRNIIGKKLNHLRSEGFLPAIIYGHGIASVPAQIKYSDFEKIYKLAGENTLVNINLDDQKHSVLIYDVAKDPQTGKFLHVDFYQVKMDEKIKAKIPLIFIGESEAVKNLGGILVKNIYEVEVESLPRDLPKELVVDLSHLKILDDVIRINNLSLQNGVKILSNPEEIIVSTIVAKAEEEVVETAAVEKEKIEAVKVETEEKKFARGGEKTEEKDEKEIKVK